MRSASPGAWEISPARSLRMLVRTDGATSIVHVKDIDQATLFGLIGLVEQLGLELLEVRLLS